MNTHVTQLVVSLAAEKEKAPDAEDVTAGWLGFWIFLGLIVAVAIIGWALTKSLKTAGRAKDAGVYGDEPVADDADPSDGEPGPAGHSEGDASR